LVVLSCPSLDVLGIECFRKVETEEMNGKDELEVVLGRLRHATPSSVPITVSARAFLIIDVFVWRSLGLAVC
jgi:hypothetical protein